MVRRYSKAAIKEYADAAFLAAIRSFTEKLQAVGSTPADRLAWLGGFVRRELSDDASRASAAGQLDAFLLWHYQAWAGDTNSAAELQQHIEPHDVPRIQGEVRTLLDGIGDDGPVWFSASVADGLLWRPDRGVFLVTRAPGLPQVLTTIAALLMAIGPRLRRCETPACRRLFAMKRPGQKRCTTKCGATDRVRKWRRENPARLSENQHRQYARTRLPGRATRRKRA